MSVCGAVHPDTGLACHCEGVHPQHLAGYGPGRVSWPVEELSAHLDRLNAPKLSRQERQETLVGIARRTRGEQRSGPPVRPSMAAAARERDVGMARVDRAADAAWKEAAWQFLLAYAATHEEIFCDDLWEAGLPPTDTPRALGPLMRQAVREGVLAPTGGYRLSVSSHLNAKSVWRSLLYRGAS
jgi:hypothetical protein